jgi:DNA repair exonuclease SbcCD ATPase subunit
MSKLQDLRQTLTRKQGEQNRIQRQLEEVQIAATDIQKELEFTQAAKAIIQKVAKATQQQLEYYISELVTLGFASVFPRPYEFGVTFEEKRGKTECRMRFLRDGKEVNPLYGSGGGPLDIAAATMRFTIYSLNKTHPIIGFDEPFRFLSKDLHQSAGEMLKEVSEKLNLQILITTHSEDLADQADKKIEFGIQNGMTYIKNDELKDIKNAKSKRRGN